MFRELRDREHEQEVEEELQTFDIQFCLTRKKREAYGLAGASMTVFREWAPSTRRCETRKYLSCSSRYSLSPGATCFAFSSIHLINLSSLK